MTEASAGRLRVALVGNPNSGKTTIFNQLTGEKGAVGNYSGVTVDLEKGDFSYSGIDFEVIDLPGIYSLTTFSNDEVVTRNFLLKDNTDVIVNVVDSSNLERNLFLTLQLMELGLPILIVLNMVDLAKQRGFVLDSARLSTRLGFPVVQYVGTSGEDVTTLIEGICKASVSKEFIVDSCLCFSDEIEREIENIEIAIDSLTSNISVNSTLFNRAFGVQWLLGGETSSPWHTSSNLLKLKDETPFDVTLRRRWLAIKLLEDDEAVVDTWLFPEISTAVSEGIKRLASSDGTPIVAKLAAERYSNVRKICRDSVLRRNNSSVVFSDRVDRFLTHPVWGLLTFFLAMFVVFWLTFTVGNYPVSWLECLQQSLIEYCNQFWGISSGSLLRSLVVDCIITGVGGVLLFLPNIFILFGAISALEESGYMARGAFLTDRFLSRIGLTGKSFIPMLVGFGCSVPAVLATRIIEDKRARLTTIFVIPLMSCGARFPIYMLIIPAFFPQEWQAPILWLVYVLGIFVAAVMSTILARMTFKGAPAPLLLELPVYHLPTLKTVGAKAFDRGWQYLRKAGTTILGLSILLWALSAFPTLSKEQLELFDAQESALVAEANALGIDLDFYQNSVDIEDVFQSAGDSSTLQDIEPTILDENRVTDSYVVDDGFDTRRQIVALVERRNQINADKNEASLEHSVVGRIGKLLEPIGKFAGFDWRIGSGLIGALAAKEVFVSQMGIVYKIGEVGNSTSLRETLTKEYSPLVGVCVIIFCLIGAPCMTTLVVVAKETSWFWALTQWVTLTVVGFGLAVIVYQLAWVFHLGT